ncbi:uncharacterized protein LOC122647324 [Telopea speciosissima]|uniref:uncharacterized protein LOC122647324 n=1 Tax=Telopea speciosissima TaxID=54955 RepID=UPI001CC766AE|nr:uncharacterized protein LOC122647324 [Telopea speciosissima]
MIALHCDGSLTADRAAYGGLIRDDTGAVILAYVGKGDDDSVLGMELLPILRGVTLCIQNDFRRVSIRFDSKLVVDILNGTICCPWSMQVLKGRISSLLEQLQRKEIRHVWREVNQPTDFIAAFDAGDGESILLPLDFPPELVEMIRDDADRKPYFRPPCQ